MGYHMQYDGKGKNARIQAMGKAGQREGHPKLGMHFF